MHTISEDIITSHTRIKSNNLRELARMGALKPAEQLGGSEPVQETEQRLGGRGQRRTYDRTTALRLGLASGIARAARTELSTSFRIALSVVYGDEQNPAEPPHRNVIASPPLGSGKEAYHPWPAFMRIYDGEIICVPHGIDRQSRAQAWWPIGRIQQNGGVQIVAETWTRNFQFHQPDGSLADGEEYAFRRLKGLRRVHDSLHPLWHWACSPSFLRVDPFLFRLENVRSEDPRWLKQNSNAQCFIHIPVGQILTQLDRAFAAGLGSGDA